MKIVILLLFSIAVLIYLLISNFNSSNKIVCYYTNLSFNGIGKGNFDVEDINTNLCTHLIFGFIGINKNATIKIIDSLNHIDKKALLRFTDLKEKNSKLKVLIAVSGESENYSHIVNNPDLRTTFIKNILNFIKTYNFDGLEIDWKYPGDKDGAKTDKKAFMELIKELRHSFNKEGLLLTASVATTPYLIITSYNAKFMSKYLDIINLMTYDMNGVWNNKTGQNAPLYSSDTDLTNNIHACVMNWKKFGANPRKLVLGIPAYGRSFTLQNPDDHGTHAPATKFGKIGHSLHQEGILPYYEICELKETGEWREIWDDEQKVPYLFKDDQWIGYDNVRSVQMKANYAKTNNLGGVMIWPVNFDDKKGFCKQGKFPLLQTIRNVIQDIMHTYDEEILEIRHNYYKKQIEANYMLKRLKIIENNKINKSYPL